MRIITFYIGRRSLAGSFVRILILLIVLGLLLPRVLGFVAETLVPGREDSGGNLPPDNAELVLEAAASRVEEETGLAGEFRAILKELVTRLEQFYSGG